MNFDERNLLLKLLSGSCPKSMVSNCWKHWGGIKWLGDEWLMKIRIIGMNRGPMSKRLGVIELWFPFLLSFWILAELVWLLEITHSCKVLFRMACISIRHVHWLVYRELFLLGNKDAILKAFSYKIISSLSCDHSVFRSNKLYFLWKLKVSLVIIYNCCM